MAYMGSILPKTRTKMRFDAPSNVTRKVSLFGVLVALLYWPQLLAALSLPTATRTTVAEIHQQYADYPEGKHVNERVTVDVVVQEVKPMSPRLVFLRTNGAKSGDAIELLLRERDNFLSTAEIATIQETAIRPGATLHCRAFPERLSLFDGPSFFRHLERPEEPICLHVTAANVSLANGVLLTICPQERSQAQILPPGRMPSLLQNRKNESRSGNRNRDRGSIFAAWAIDTFNIQPRTSHILDIAGGSGQLAFQFGVRRGLNVTVVDPRPLRLTPDQQRSLEYHRKTGLRQLPGERNPRLPAECYGHHFFESSSGTSDRTFSVGGDAQVRDLQQYFDANFASTDAWQDCSVVLGMHPDEATEDLVDLALQHNKPFAVVPCCVFWRRDPNRKTPSGKQVRTWEQFCDYLAAKDERILVTTLPFPGRNTVLYSMGGR